MVIARFALVFFSLWVIGSHPALLWTALAVTLAAFCRHDPIRALVATSSTPYRLFPLTCTLRE